MYYKYSILSETGNEIKGVEEGRLESVRKTLKEKSCYIISLKPDILRSIKSCFVKRRIKAQNLSIFFEDMANMLRLGIAVNEAVSELKESSTIAALTKALDSIDKTIKSGLRSGLGSGRKVPGSCSGFCTRCRWTLRQRN